MLDFCEACQDWKKSHDHKCGSINRVQQITPTGLADILSMLATHRTVLARTDRGTIYFHTSIDGRGYFKVVDAAGNTPTNSVPATIEGAVEILNNLPLERK